MLTLRTVSVAIVMPAYNEADGIEGFLDELVDVVGPTVHDLKVVVVDDASTDGTAEIVAKYAERTGHGVESVASTRNRGHGPTSLRALRSGVALRPDVVVHVDGDGQFEAEAILQLLDAIASGADVALGVRQDRQDPWFRKVLTHMTGAFLHVWARLNVRDANCPLRAYRTEVLERLLAITPDELLVPSICLNVMTERQGYEIAEINVRHLVRRGAEATGSMWGGARSVVLPSKRLITFSAHALAETLVVLPRLAKQAARPVEVGAGQSTER
jgi:glycosyltransferase involved in cell wall biosynthesis